MTALEELIFNELSGCFATRRAKRVIAARIAKAIIDRYTLDYKD